MSDLKVTTATNGEASGAAAAKTSAADIAKVFIREIFDRGSRTGFLVLSSSSCDHFLF